MLCYHLGLFMPRAREATAARGLGNGYSFGGDFYPVWLTSKEWLRARRDPYGLEMTREIQTGLFGRPLDSAIPTDFTDLRMFAHPAFTALLFWPASGLPFTVARVVLVVLLAAMTIASVFLWIRALSWHLRWTWLAVVVLLLLFSYPALEGLYAGQLGLFVAFLLAAAILALQRGRYLLAGILMALATIKPQTTLLAILCLLIWSTHDWRTRNRFFVGFFSTEILLIGFSLAVWPHWISSWLRVAAAYHRYAKPPLLSEVLSAALGSTLAGPSTFAITGTLLGVVVWLAWRSRKAPASSSGFWLTLSLALAVTTVTLLPGQAVYDHVILLPAVLFLARQRRALRASRTQITLMALGAAMILWPWVSALGLIAFRPFVQQHYSSAILSLPLRTAAAFPFVVLAMLALARRKKTAVVPDASLPG